MTGVTDIIEEKYATHLRKKNDEWTYEVISDIDQSAKGVHSSNR